MWPFFVFTMHSKREGTPSSTLSRRPFRENLDRWCSQYPGRLLGRRPRPLPELRRQHSAERLCAQGASRAQTRRVPKRTWRNAEECFDLCLPSPLLPSHVINATEVLVTRNPTLSSSSIEKKVPKL